MSRTRPFTPIVPLLALALSACFSGGDDGPPPGGGGGGGNPPPATPPQFVVAPSVAPNPNPAVPLAALVTLETDVPAEVTLHLDDGQHSLDLTPEPGFQRQHELVVLGLKPGRMYTLTAEAVDQEGDSALAPAALALATEPLPTIFPPLEVTVSQPALMEPGVTLFNARFSHDTIDGSEWGMLVMLDEAGEVVWFYQASHRIGDARRLSNGNLLYLYGRQGMAEIDVLGNVVGSWWASNQGTDGAPLDAVFVATDCFHHEAFELPPELDGDFLVLSTERRTFADYPALESDPDRTEPSAEVVGDVVLEVRRDGTIARSWSLLDLIDPYRISYGSLGGFWDPLYGLPTRDWSHANAAILDASDDSVIVSVRHQEALLKIARADGHLVWILGPPQRWDPPWRDLLLAPLGAEPPDGFPWSYHQHAPMITVAGDLLLFDNGNGRAVAPDPQLPSEERYSRAVVYHVDPAQRTVAQVWAYGGPEDPWYSSFLGDADELPTTGNVLVADGGKTAPDSRAFARLVEVTRSDPPQIVFEVLIDDDSGEPPFSWTVYRAERLAGVYP